MYSYDTSPEARDAQWEMKLQTMVRYSCLLIIIPRKVPQNNPHIKIKKINEDRKLKKSFSSFGRV